MQKRQERGRSRDPGVVAGRGRERKIAAVGDHDVFVPGTDETSVARADWQQSGQGAAGGDADAERLVYIGAESSAMIDMEELEDETLDHVLERDGRRVRSLSQPREPRKREHGRRSG